MADLVHEDLRGRYFSYRNRVASFVTLVCSFGAGAVLQIFSGNVFIGFAGIFGGAIFPSCLLCFLSHVGPPAHPTQNGPGSTNNKGLGSQPGRFTVFVG
jgi:hypothetical protein